jgi:hypothetical protein
MSVHFTKNSWHQLGKFSLTHSLNELLVFRRKDCLNFLCTGISRQALAVPTEDVYVLINTGKERHEKV